MSMPARTPNIGMVPLGLFSLGVATFLLAGQFGGWIDALQFVPYAIFTGGLAMMVAGIMALREDNPFAGTAFSLIGSFFVAVGFDVWFFASGEKNHGADLAWVTLAWAVVLLLLALASFGVARMPMPGKIMWVILFLGFLLAWISAAFQMDWARTAASIAGIIVAIMAVLGGYMSLREVMADAGGP
jgi:succinate-acetate transporter protein